MSRQSLYCPTPWMNAAGTLGFLPSKAWNLPEAQGVFVTNPLSLHPRTPAAQRTALTDAGNLLVHSGLPNPGLVTALRRYARKWEKSPIPVWVHLIPQSPEECYRMIQLVENSAGVSAIEISLPPRLSTGEKQAFLSAMDSELPIVLVLPLNGEEIPVPLDRISAVTLSAPRGMLPSPSGAWIEGRLFSISLFPQMLYAVKQVVQHGIPVIAGAGIYRRAHAQHLLQAGAMAIQVDTVLWKGFLND
ncbi:hypothetical protein [Anaerolinea sp.]|uniref:hypothetical protein n=1 Tax=Anaerolinea sp. TaxID=1872519 RepID=UPI002ACD2328|nr:hypothetical protein [Anaerolinea sp.]